MILPSGQGGSGVLYGTNHISLGGYRAVHHTAHEIRTATVSTSGDVDLDIDIEAVLWIVARERGVPPHERARDELQDKRFRVLLHPQPGRPKTLRGRHEYEQGLKLYSVADEVYIHKS